MEIVKTEECPIPTVQLRHSGDPAHFDRGYTCIMWEAWDEYMESMEYYHQIIWPNGKEEWRKEVKNA